VAYSGMQFRLLWRILGTAFFIVSSYGCVNPTIDNATIGIPTLESAQDSRLSAEPAPLHNNEERNEPVAEALDPVEPQESSSETGEINCPQAPAKEGAIAEFDSLISTDNDKAIALNRVLYLCGLSQIEWKQGELEGAIETLDQAYALLLRVNPENNPSFLQEKEDLRVAISRRMLEIYSSRILTVKSNNRKEIPIPLNKHVQDEIDVFTTGREKDFFLLSYRRSGRYRAKIEAELQAAGLPTELAWLPLVESGFKVAALSPARALGLWQFIPSTGYRYNLNRNNYIDERLDAEKSTRGAIEYLKELHEMFGDWTTVLAAYNCGEHRVLRTIQSQHINYLDNFWDLYERLPHETARYVPRFLATVHIVQNFEKYGLSEVAVDPPLQYESVTVSMQTSLKSIARTTGIDDELLKELNAELRRGILPADGYDLRVPPGAGSLVAAHTNDFPIYQMRSENSRKTHKVPPGETLSSIGKRYRVSIKRLKAANGSHKPKKLQAGAVLRLPGNQSSEAHARRTRSPSPPRNTIEYVVQPGDSLFKIAKRFETTTEKIQRLNNMSTTSLSVGQILKIQTSADLTDEA
jgi:membrane-bound lytic murein transglycosylase D